MMLRHHKASLAGQSRRYISSSRQPCRRRCDVVVGGNDGRVERGEGRLGKRHDGGAAHCRRERRNARINGTREKPMPGNAGADDVAGDSLERW